MEYVLVTQGLSKHYKDFKALDNLTMRVPKGSIYGFVGRNGAGKTTLIRLICGLQTPTAGEYSLYGTDSREKGIGAVRRRGALVIGLAGAGRQQEAQGQQQCQEFCRMLHRRITFFP